MVKILLEVQILINAIETARFKRNKRKTLHKLVGNKKIKNEIKFTE